MPNWNELLSEVKSAAPVPEQVRRKYLKKLHQYTSRNVIIYYSGWLQKADRPGTTFRNTNINDNDKNGFMATIHRMDRKKGLDLLLHTPGGDLAATESIVDYLRSMFGTNIRAFVPHLAMSAGTMIALSCETIVMGKHSSIGPIDPQIGGVAAHGILEEFQQAVKDITDNPDSKAVWQPIIAKYHPTLIGDCQKAIKWSEDIVTQWLITGMFKGDKDAKTKASKIVKKLGDHGDTKAHNRHISCNQAHDLDIHVTALEDDPKLQEAVLTVHHACILTLSMTSATKIIENHMGVGFIETVSSP